jgi:hypothetical protein
VALGGPAIPRGPVLFALLFDWPLRILWPHAVVLLLAAALALLTPAIERWQARRALEAAPELRDLTYRFTEAGLLLSTAVSSTELKWEGVQQAIETEDLFLLFVGEGAAYYVPSVSWATRPLSSGSFST